MGWTGWRPALLRSPRFVSHMSPIHGMYLASGAMLALAGGALGFLPYNFYPARIFME